MTGLPKPPSIFSILFGIALSITVLLALFRLPDVVKYSGAALMYMPAKLGFIDMVTPKEVIPLPLTENPTLITIPSTGQYLLYLGNLDLLFVHDAVVEGGAKNWIRVQPVDVESDLDLTLIGRGLTWYDTPFAAGRPVATFRIDEPGVYRVIHPTRPDTAYLVPDTLTGKESRIKFWVLAEILLIVGGIFYVVRKRTAAQRAQRVRTLAENRARVEATRKRIEKRAEDKLREEDQPYWKKR